MEPAGLGSSPPGPADATSGATRSMARARQGAFQDFIARHLILSTTAPFAVKVRLICEAGQAISWGDSKADAAISEQFRVLGMQSLAVEGAFRRRADELEAWSVRWLPASIADDRMYEDFFSEWDGGEEFQSLRALEMRDPMVGNAQARLDNLSRRNRFIVRTRFLTEEGFLGLKASFYQYAEEPAMKFFAEISKRVDPTVYERALRASRGEL